MEKLNTISLLTEGPVCQISLNRREVHNAMNLEMIRELTRVFGRLENHREVRILHFTAAGENFSAGADLNWMKEGSDLPPSRLKSESLELAGLFARLEETELVTVSSIRGRAVGGAIGIVALSDVVVAEESALFGFPEVKLGLIPATIAPYVLNKTVKGPVNELMITGRLFGAEEAKRIGMVHRICVKGKLETASGEVIRQLKGNGPEAMKGVKRLLKGLEKKSTEEVREYTAELIARYRTSREGLEGMNAFFEKRKPGWDGGA